MKNLNKVAVGADLKGRLDALPSTKEGLWDHFELPVVARATSELARRLLRNDADGIHLYAVGQHGIGMPTEELASLIYVPKAILEIDRESKAGDRDNGISLTSYDDKNAFGGYPPSPHRTKADGFLDYVWAGYRGRHPLQGLRSGSHEAKLAGLRTDREYQLAMARYAMIFLTRLNRRNEIYYGKYDYTTDLRETNLLAKELILMYAAEMGVRLS